MICAKRRMRVIRCIHTPQKHSKMKECVLKNRSSPFSELSASATATDAASCEQWERRSNNSMNKDIQNAGATRISSMSVLRGFTEGGVAKIRRKENLNNNRNKNNNIQKTRWQAGGYFLNYINVIIIRMIYIISLIFFNLLYCK